MMEYLQADSIVQRQDAQILVKDLEFLRIEPEVPGAIPEEYEKELTRGDVIDIFASIFGRGACGKPDAPDSYDVPDDGDPPQKSATNYLLDKYPGREGAQQLSAEFGLGDLCRQETINGGQITRPVYVHASSELVFDQYDIVAPGCKLSKPQHREHDIHLKIEFSNTTYATIYYFIDQVKLSKYLSNPLYYGKIFEWRGAVKDQDGKTVDNPTFKIQNGRIYFPGNWSGKLIIKRLPIKYHYYNIIIDGYIDADATRHYIALVSGKAPGISIVQLEISEEETAKETKTKCPWLDFDYQKNGAGTATETTCGNCGDDDDEKPSEPQEPDAPQCEDTITAEEYNEQCCGGPLIGCLPSCLSVTTSVYGSAKQEEPNDYCGPTSVIVLMPKNNEPCGTLTTTYTTSGSCEECEGVVNLVWDDGNPDIIAPGGSVVVGVTGGKLPINWSISGGTGYSFVGGVTDLEGGGAVEVFASGDVCGPGDIKADDGCSQASGSLQHTGDILTTESSMIVDPGSGGRVYLATGVGVPPYNWTPGGPVTIWRYGGPDDRMADFLLEEEQCESGSIDVSDKCGSSTTVDIINSSKSVEITAPSMTVVPGSGGRVYLAAGTGVPPYNWTPNGPVTIWRYGGPDDRLADFLLEGEQCESGSINVAGKCGNASIDIINDSKSVEITVPSMTVAPGSGSRVYLAAGTGVPPYNWTTSGPVTIWRYGGPDDRLADFLLEEEQCESGSIDVSGKCGDASVEIINDYVDILVRDANLIMPPDSGGRVYVKDGTGIPPYNWSVNGNITIWRYGGPNDRIADVINNEGGGTVTVSDPCSDDVCTITDG